MRPVTPETFWKTTASALCALALFSAAVCAEDCNSNGVEDSVDITDGTSLDCNANGVPDECDTAAGSLLFEVRRTLVRGGNTSNVVVEDFDSDGDLDIVCDVEEFEVLLNQGNGEFSDPVNHLVDGDNRPWNMIASDLDKDGDKDLLAACYETTAVPVLFNRGDGTFDLSVHNYLSVPPGKPQLADFDGDGDVDFVAPDWNLPSISVLRNRGDGTFEEAERFATRGNHTPSLVVADWDTNGSPDLGLVVRYLTDGDTNPLGEVVVLLNDGNADFSSSSFLEVGGRPKDLAAADLDGDGVQDLAVVCFDPEDVWVFRGLGTGAFSEPVRYPAGQMPRIVRGTDLDADGDVDLVCTGGDHRDGPADIAILRNRGDGTFDDTQLHEVTGQSACLEFADLDRDGLPEILVALYFAGDTVVLKNLGDGEFEKVATLDNGRGGTVTLQAHDFDSDGDLDIVTGHLNTNNSVSLLTNATGQGISGGCATFLRGDANMDGSISISDMVTVRRFLFGPDLSLPCEDAADLTDDERLTMCDVVSYLEALFWHPDWTFSLPAPSLEPGLDPTSEPGPEVDYCGDAPRPEFSRIGCSEYIVEPAEESDDLIRIGDASGPPGSEVRFPVYLTASVPVSAVQLVIEYDPVSLEITSESIDHESCYWTQPDISLLTVHPESGVVTVAMVGNLIDDSVEIEPGEDIQLAWITARVSEDATPDTELILMPVNGDGAAGVGPYGLRNEICYRGDALLVSTLPRLEGGILAIVGDQAFFRGDSNQDEQVDISDAMDTLDVLFKGSSTPIACEDAADATDDGKIDISDPIFTLNFLFLGGAPLPPPWPEKGYDPTADALRCLP